ncbi:MAG: hypothetical protein ACREUE_15820, partial [Panacagrimonas sp.]
MIERARNLAHSRKRAKLARLILQQCRTAKPFDGALPVIVRYRFVSHPMLESHSIPMCKMIKLAQMGAPLRNAPWGQPSLA